MGEVFTVFGPTKDTKFEPNWEFCGVGNGVTSAAFTGQPQLDLTEYRSETVQTERNLCSQTQESQTETKLKEYVHAWA